MARLFFIPLGMVLLLTSCLTKSTIRSIRSDYSSGDTVPAGGAPPPVEGDGVLPGEGRVDGVLDKIIHQGKVELRHIVDPFTGTYKTKITLPKNFKGPLYISGLNVSSLSRHLLSVRFYFGRELGIVEVPATVGRAPGITPQTDIEVLILDMDSKPFEKVRLFYDLYDYNDYDSNDDGVEFGEGDALNAPVVDAGDGGLYCRGLKLEHDPSFQGSSSNNLCEESGEKCLYAYAKLKDSGLMDEEGLSMVPRHPHVSLGVSRSPQDSLLVALETGLPDFNSRTFFENIFKLNLHPGMELNFPSGTGSGLGFGDAVEVVDRVASPPERTVYTYRGPYRPVNLKEWEIGYRAIQSDVQRRGSAPTGLFQNFATNTTGNIRYDCSVATKSSGCAHRGVRSFLFPRAGTMNLRGGVEHYASDSPLYSSGGRGLKSLFTGGETGYMDGVNLRLNNRDSFSNEGMGSCNVTATINIVSKNPSSGATTTLASSKAIKLQLIRPRLNNSEGKDVLYTSMKNCTNSSGCAYDECCYNNRCWSKNLVSQCMEESSTSGNRSVGESCSSDLECSSLCCNSSSGTCGVHTNQGGEDIFCSKWSGETCVAQDWCRREYLSQCFVVKTGLDSRGKQLCALRCYNVPTSSDCRNGICHPPTPPTMPFFDPDNPNCEGAEDPPTKF